jgi:hypothetical protein
MTNILYQEILESEIQDLFPDAFTESYYSIPLEPRHLVKVLSLLRTNNEIDVYSYVVDFLQDEYQDFKL